MFLAIDFKGGGGGGGVWAKNVSFGGGFLPDYIIAIEDETTYEVLNWNGTDWEDVKSNMADFNRYIGFNTEIQLSRSNLSCTEFTLSVFVTANVDNTSAFDVAPNDSGVGPMYTDIDVISSGVLIKLEEDDDGDDDDDTDKGPPVIPGYNLYFLISIFCIITAILIKKRFKSKK